MYNSCMDLLTCELKGGPFSATNQIEALGICPVCPYLRPLLKLNILYLLILKKRGPPRYFIWPVNKFQKNF